MNDVSSSTTGSSSCSSRTATSLSSEGFDAGSGSVTSSFTSSFASYSFALKITKHTFSGKIVSVCASSAGGLSVFNLDVRPPQLGEAFAI